VLVPWKRHYLLREMGGLTLQSPTKLHSMSSVQGETPKSVRIRVLTQRLSSAISRLWRGGKRKRSLLVFISCLFVVAGVAGGGLRDGVGVGLGAVAEGGVVGMKRVAQTAAAGWTTARTSTFGKFPLAFNFKKGIMKEPEYVAKGTEMIAQETSRTVIEAIKGLGEYMHGSKNDILILLLTTGLITPLFKLMSLSPILGFLLAGTLLGPNGFGVISNVHSTEGLGELGIVFFLFEMGIELSSERLKSMKRDVFGLGLSQFFTTAFVIALVGSKVGLQPNQLVVLGGALALSSSAFVLQLLKDKGELGTRHGKASFGILLFQDLAVVPLLVVTPILASGGSGLAKALASASIKAMLALGAIAVIGRTVLNRMFDMVAAANSQEAFLGITLLTVLSMSFLTEGLGLSNTLGAFLAGVLLSETKYRYQIEADIAPFRGILLGLFFCTVGFEIDVALITRQFPQISGIVCGIIALKAIVTTVLAKCFFGLTLSNAQQAGLLLAQGGEFAFVAFGMARSLGIFDAHSTRLLLTSVALTMGFTPMLAALAGKIATRIEEQVR